MGNLYFAHVNYWLTKFTNPVHVLVYEKLQKDTLWELYKISKFINTPVTFETLWCIQSKKASQTTYLRKKPSWLSAKNMYTNDKKTVLNAVLQRLISSVGVRYTISETLVSYRL